MPTAPYVLSIDTLDGSDKLIYRAATPDGERIDVPRLERYATAKQTAWAWPGKVPLGRVTLIEGAAGSGKSFVALDLAARINGSRNWPDGQARVLPDADVLVLCRNDDPSRTISARFQQAGGDPARLVHFREFSTVMVEDRQHGHRPFLFPFDMLALEEFLEDQPAVGVIIIDPLSDFCETPRQLTETLFKLEELAERANAVVIVTLPADCRTDAQGRLKVRSRWATDAARCAWCIIADPDDPRRRLFVARRTNFCQEPDGLSFRLSDGGVLWDASEPIDALDPLGKLTGCEKCLKELVSQGDVPASQVFRQGAECGFTPKEMRAAARRLEVTSDRVGYGGDGRWVWSYGEVRRAVPEHSHDEACQGTVRDLPLPLEEGGVEGDGAIEQISNCKLKNANCKLDTGAGSASSADGPHPKSPPLGEEDNGSDSGASLLEPDGPAVGDEPIGGRRLALFKLVPGEREGEWIEVLEEVLPACVDSLI
jgi:hypothetical protein